MSRRPTRPPQEEPLISPGVSSGSYLYADMTPSGRGPLRIALGGREQCGPSYAVRRSGFPFVTLEYVAEGRGTLSRGKEAEQALQPGSLFAHGPGLEHVISAGDSGMVKYFLCLNGRGAKAFLNKHAPVFEAPCLIPRHAELRELFDWIIREGQEQSVEMQEICLRLLDVLLIKVAQSLSLDAHSGGKALNRFMECKAHIEAHATRVRGLDELCRELRIDASNLSRLFRRFQGSSPYQYLVRCRMNSAAREFMEGEALVKEVAARLGYEDAYHFSRLFKAVHGMSPARFRALYI